MAGPAKKTAAKKAPAKKASSPKQASTKAADDKVESPAVEVSPAQPENDTSVQAAPAEAPTQDSGNDSDDGVIAVTEGELDVPDQEEPEGELVTIGGKQFRKTTKGGHRAV